MRRFFSRVRQLFVRPGLARPRTRALRWLKRTAIVIACLPIALPILVLSALAIPLTRKPIVALALDLTNNALGGMRIELDAVERLDLWGIELKGARLFDDKKRELVSVRKLRVRIAPFSLVTGTLSLPDAEVAGTRIHLYPSDDEEEEEEEEEESEPSSFQILAHNLSVKDLTFDMDLSGKALHAQLHELLAHGAYGPKTRATIEKLALEADLDGEHATALHSEYAFWDEKKGGKAALAGDLLGAVLRIAYVAPPITDDTRWPVRRAELHLTGLKNAGLARVGYGDAAQLRVPVDLHVQAATSGARDELLAGDVALKAGKLMLALKGSASPSTYTLEAVLPPADLAEVSGILPVLRAGLKLSVEARHDVTPMRVDAKWREVSLDNRAVPSGSLRAVLPLPVVRLERLTLAGLEQALSLQGEYNTASNAASVALDTHELSLASFGGLLPEGIDGSINGRLRAAYAAQKLSGDAALSLRYFCMVQAPASAREPKTVTRIDNASLALDLSGTPHEPRGNFKLAAYQIQSGKTRIARVALAANAGLRDLDGSLEVEGNDRLLSLILTGTRANDGALTVNASGQGRIKDKQLGLKLKDLQITKDHYAVQELQAFSGRERLQVSGALTGGKAVDVSLQLSNVDLAPWTRLLLDDEIKGLLDLTARAGGTLSQPSAEVSLDVHGLRSLHTPRAPAIDLATKALLDTAKHRARLSVDAHSMDRRVAITLSADATLARSKALARAFTRAQLKLDLKGHTDVPFLAQFAQAQLGPLDGQLSADVSVSGSMEEAEMYAKFASELAPRDEQSKNAPDRVDLDIVLKPATLNVDLIVQDRFGKVIDLTSQAELPAGGPNALIERGSKLIHTPVDLKLTVNERRLDKLQGSLGMLTRTYGASLPVRAKAQVELASTGEAIQGKVDLRAHVWGEGLDDTCPAQAEADLTLAATLAGDEVEGKLTATPSGGGNAQVTFESKLLVDSVLDGSAFGWGPGELSVRADALALHTVPTLCMLPESKTSLRLDASNLGKVPLAASLTLDVKDVRTSEGAMSVHLEAESAPDALTANGKLALGGVDKGRFFAKAPLVYADGPLPAVPLDKPFSAALDLPDFPLAGITSFTSAIGRAGGRVRANLKVAGTLGQPDPSGVIELKAAAFSIAALAQPLSGINARLELAPDRLVIRKLSARDRSGKLSLVGYVRYNPTRGGEAELHLSADKFPMRQQGSIIGELSTRAVLEGKIDAQKKMSLVLDLKQGRIWLTGEGGHQVQELDDHPDIRFDTDRLQPEGQEPEPTEAALTLALFHIKSDRDLWLMHKDFAVQVGVDMKVTSEEERVLLKGEANITRGDLNLLGKPFRIDRGAIRFTGDVPPDPELDLKAKYTTRQGEVLIVQIQGRASAPQILFSGAANNAGEAAALITGIGSSAADSTAKGEAANFAANLTAGLLAVSARRRFGDWVPMLGIENNAQGAVSGARAGFDASALIPKFMRGFARGIFVEGVVGSRDNQRSVGVGVHVDLALPRDFMTSVGYGPGTVWSTDVFWSP
jgi:autotransporter translocation and assembly factor TamB